MICHNRHYANADAMLLLNNTKQSGFSSSGISKLTNDIGRNNVTENDTILKIRK